MPYLIYNDLKIYYQETTGREPLMIFVHGAGGSSRRWSAQLEALKGLYRAVALDLPGHGQSGGKPLASITEYAELVAGFVDALHSRKFVLAGHSMGGAIALEFTLCHAEKLQGLILVGTGARLRVNPQVLGTLAGGELPLHNINNLFGSAVPQSLVQSFRREMEELPAALYLADYQACDSFDRMSDIQKIKVPTLIIVGDEDKMTPVKYAQYLNNQIANSRLKIIYGAGHMTMLEKPREVNEAIIDFLNMIRAN
ncbi:alpha/beta hydrolase [Desulfofundulus sp. TPOSR]|uniref:alpha/beta fold hydrolase n=1 Tax=Desulfofundulus sp. TPOSR TaxID=2714340 RepID=UPI00140ABE96|nr:alpha/beta hydrolase [Desulfofundulus sp. TPOSR]NHM26381.1 alpha/beta hydrolase [Desulfofundulus sp. TPOSR]